MTEGKRSPSWPQRVLSPSGVGGESSSLRRDDGSHNLTGHVGSCTFPVPSHPPHKATGSVLVLQRDRQGRPVHVVWGIPKGQDSPAVLITAYRPDPEKWKDGFSRRKQ
jgi:hypothetical protein